MVKLRRKRKKALISYDQFKVFNNNCLTLFRSGFIEIHNYNLRGSNYDLQLPLPKTNFLNRSFSYRGEMAWNQLSNETREIEDLTTGRRGVICDGK